jgi:anti-sigma B factor antagonist
MNVEVIENTQVVVRVSGDVELPTVNGLREAIESAASKAPDGFVIDMTDVRYVDSAGISTLVFAYRKVCPNGGKLAVVISDKNVRRIVTLTRLETLPGISLFEDVAEAESFLTKDLAHQ